MADGHRGGWSLFDIEKNTNQFMNRAFSIIENKKRGRYTQAKIGK